MALKLGLGGDMRPPPPQKKKKSLCRYNYVTKTSSLSKGDENRKRTQGKT